MTAVLQVVPRLGPDGVGAFAERLGIGLGGAGLEVHDLALGSGPIGERRERLEAALAMHGRALLHYVGYGYAQRGTPVWLVDTLAAWRGHLVVAFHELYATGHPWQSSFWLSPAMRRLVRRLADAAVAVVTSTRLYADMLRGWKPAADVHELAVFATVGEPPAVSEWRQRPGRLVVFGSPGLRARSYGLPSGRLAEVCRQLDVDELYDVGDAVACELPELPGVRVRAMGRLPSAELHEVLDSARAGLLAYPGDLLGKSTVYAAYAAHGVLPVVLESARERKAAAAAPCWPGPPAELPDAGEIARWARAWYEGHCLRRHVELYRDLLGP